MVRGLAIPLTLNVRHTGYTDGLHVHASCNTAYKADEEYYAALFAGHADTATGRAVFADWRRGVAKGHDQGLLKTILIGLNLTSARQRA